MPRRHDSRVNGWCESVDRFSDRNLGGTKTLITDAIYYIIYIETQQAELPGGINEHRTTLRLSLNHRVRSLIFPLETTGVFYLHLWFKKTRLTTVIGVYAPTLDAEEDIKDLSTPNSIKS